MQDNWKGADAEVKYNIELIKAQFKVLKPPFEGSPIIQKEVEIQKNQLESVIGEHRTKIKEVCDQYCQCLEWIKLSKCYKAAKSKTNRRRLLHRLAGA